MTVQEMIIEVFENSTENSELNPYDTLGDFDITSTGAVRGLGYLNRAYNYVCAYKDGQTKRRLRIEELHKQLQFKTSIVSGTSQGGGSDDTVVFKSGSSAVDDTYNGYVIKITGGTGNGQIRVIMDYDGGTVTGTLNRDWITNPDSTSTYNVYKNFFSLSEMGISPNERVFGILKVLDMKLKEEIHYGDRVDTYVRDIENDQRPTEYIFDQNRLLFNCPFDDVRWYQIEYYALPDELSSESESPVIPEQFHDAMIFYANHLDAKKMRDDDSAEIYFRSCINSLRTGIVDDDVMQDRLDGNMYIDTSYIGV